MDDQKTFVGIATNFIKREGVSGLLAELTRKGFFEVPASIAKHHSYDGGLAQHSIEVFYNLHAINNRHKLNLSNESMAIVALFHDVCKLDAYIHDGIGWARNSNAWHAGHGEKSVFIIMQYMKLHRNEIEAIRWHMGEFSDELQRSWAKNPLAVALHLADTESAFFS